MIEIHVDDAPAIRDGVCHVIAEAGANHNNSVERAIEMARLASKAGAWGVKYQLYRADSISVPSSPKYWTDSIGTETQYEAFKLSDHLPYSEFAKVAEACRSLGIVFFATPFDLEAVEALEAMRAPVYKVASADITFKPLLEAISATGKPLFLSTGAATVEEIHQAIDWLGYGPDKLVLLACTLTYPTPDEDGNFARLEVMRREFSPFMIGMSDHTLGVAGAWMTAALGGVAIEKHYTIDKSLPDVPDHAMSVDPDQLAEMVEACKRGATLRGAGHIGVRDSELPARKLARRSIVLEKSLGAGHQLTREDLGFKRPGTGLAPEFSDQIIGRRLQAGLERGTILEWDMLI